MAGQDVLQEFLVAIGFKVDEAGIKKTLQSIGAVQKQLVTLVAGLETASLAVVATVAEIASGFDKLFYTSRRTNTPVKELEAIKFAAGQVGSSAAEATAVIEGLSDKIRNNRGMLGYVQSITKDNSTNIGRQTVELVQKLAKMPTELQHSYARQFGITENFLLGGGTADFLKGIDEFNARAEKMGINLEKAGDDGRNLTNSLNGLKSTLKVIIEAAMTPLFQQLDGPIRTLNEYLTQHGRELADIIGKIASALLSITTELLKMLPSIDRFVESIGGWEPVLKGIATVVSAAFVLRMTGLLGAMRGLSMLAMPPWALAILGVGAGAAWAYSQHSDRDKINESDHAGELQGGYSGGDIDNNVGSRVGRWLKRKFGRSGGSGAGAGGGDMPTGSSAGNLTKLIEDEARLAGIDPRILQGVRAGESGHGSRYDIGDINDGGAYGPFQFNMGKGRFGDQFKRDTGLDPRDPKTIPAQTRYMAQFLARKIKEDPNYANGGRGSRLHAVWHGYAGPRNADPRWGDAGYVPTAAKAPPMVRIPPGSVFVPGHNGGAVPMPAGMPQGSNMFGKGFGGFDPAALRSTIGGGHTFHDNKTSFHNAPNINVHGVSDPHRVAEAVHHAVVRGANDMIDKAMAGTAVG